MIDSPEQVYREALARGLSDHEAREEGWPQNVPSTREEATEFAARITAAIPENPRGYRTPDYDRYAADRKRVASDLAGILDHSGDRWCCTITHPAMCADHTRYADGMTLTGSQYGETP